jgi:hypothetical protein
MPEGVNLFGDAEDNSIAQGEGTDQQESQAGAGQNQDGDSYVPEIDVPEGDTSEEGEDEQASKEDKEKPAKDDPARFQYWQSQADQYKRQLELERQQQQGMAAYAPIARYLQENPQLLDVLERELQSGHPSQAGPPRGVGEQPGERTSLERPEKPLKPRNYDPNETDPESDSYKYRQSMAEYQENLIEYMVARDERRESQAEEQRRIAEQHRQQQEQMAQLASTLKVEHGLNDFEAQDFMRTMMDQSSVTLDNLVKLYKITQGDRGKQSAEAKRKAQDIVNRTGRKVPLPAGVGGVNAPQVSDEDIFNASLAHFGNR